MSECCENRVMGYNDSHNRSCNFDMDMILWVLIIIVIVTCMCNN